MCSAVGGGGFGGGEVEKDGLETMVYFWLGWVGDVDGGIGAGAVCGARGAGVGAIGRGGGGDQ